MLHLFGWAALTVLGTYLALFFWGGALAARAAGRPIWLFATARGKDAWAALGFRLAFGLAFFGPLLWLAMPLLHKSDPLWSEGGRLLPGLAGLVLSVAGAILALAAQMSMGASWRVGVQTGETGPLVQRGLFRFSRNPTFLGQLLLLVGVALAIPAAPTAVAPVLFYLSARVQIRSEEAALAAANRAEYDAYRRAVPRWIGWTGDQVQ